jgi:hypothetical protein
VNRFEEEFAMKFCKVSLFLTLLMVACVPAAAQTELRLNIPFEFFAAGNVLPAGHYTIVRVNGDDHTAWRIYTDHASMMVMTHSVESGKDPHRLSVVFLHTGGVYSLVEFWPTQYGGRVLPSATGKHVLAAEADRYVAIEAE